MQRNTSLKKESEVLKPPAVEVHEKEKQYDCGICHETFDDKFGNLSVWLVSVTISGVCFRPLGKKLGISPRQLTSKDQPPIFFIFDYVLLYLIFLYLAMSLFIIDFLYI